MKSRFAARLLSALACLTGPAAAVPVDLELMLAVDVSGSIDATEARLQRNGYIAALTDPRVIEVIRAGEYGRIAIAYMEWGGEHQQTMLVDWQIIAGMADAERVAGAIAASPRTLIANRTSISGAIDFARPQFARNNLDGARRVIDISGDGPNNSGAPVLPARTRAMAAGITINGLPVMNDRPNRYGLPTLPDLDLYYEACVIGGPGAFIVPAENFSDFAGAILRKFILEIAGHTPRARPRMAALPSCTIGEERYQRSFGNP